MTWEALLNVLHSCETDEDRARFNQLLHSPFCEYPHCEAFGELRHQDTAYTRALSNWHRYCPAHQREVDEAWAEQWREYYAGLL